MKILVDGMGGDNAPEEIVKGTVRAAREVDAQIAIIGPTQKIKKLLRKNKWKGDNIEIIEATEVIENTEAPAMAIRRKKDSSIVVGMNLLAASEADVLISGGSTGALLAGGMLLLGKIKGIKRPAIAAWLPVVGKRETSLLLDCGANADSKPEYLLQNGIMGSLFVSGVRGNLNPDVKLLNVGVEEGKGDELHKSAYELLKDSKLNFGGNIEGRDVIFGAADVVVADGFSGNILLKSTEGSIIAVINLLKKKLTEGTVAKAGSMLAYHKIKEIKNEFDYSNAGGAPILGLKKPVLKIHGNAKADDVYYAILRAVPYVENGVTEMIAVAVEDSFNEN